MLLSLELPRLNALMSGATIVKTHMQPGDPVRIGAKILDMMVDLSNAMQHDCPPISCFRIALSERVFLRRLLVADGDLAPVGAPLAVFSTIEDEPDEGEATRPVRCSVFSILHQTDWRRAAS